MISTIKNPRNFKKLSQIPKFQQGGWVNNSYAKLADNSQLTQVLSQPLRTGYEESLQNIQLGFQFNQQRLQRNAFDLQQKQLTFQQEQQKITNDFREKQLAAQQKQIEFNQSLSEIEIIKDFRDNVFGQDILPGDSTRLKELQKKHGMLDDEGNPITNSITDPEGYKSAYKSSIDYMNDPEVKQMQQSKIEFDLLKPELDKLGQTIKSIETDPEKSIYFDVDVMKEEQQAIYKQYTDLAKTGQGDINDIKAAIQNYKYKYSEQGEKLKEINITTAELTAQKQDIANQQDQAELTAYTSMQKELNDLYNDATLTPQDRVGKANEINARYSGKLGSLKGKGTNKSPLGVDWDKTTENERLALSVSGFYDTGVFDNPAYARALITITNDKEGTIGRGGFFSNLVIDKKNNLDRTRSSIPLTTNEEYKIPDLKAVSLTDSALKKFANRFGPVQDDSWRVRGNSHHNEATTVTFDGDAGDYGMLWTNNQEVYSAITGKPLNSFTFTKHPNYDPVTGLLGIDLTENAIRANRDNRTVGGGIIPGSYDMNSRAESGDPANFDAVYGGYAAINASELNYADMNVKSLEAHGPKYQEEVAGKYKLGDLSIGWDGIDTGDPYTSVAELSPILKQVVNMVSSEAHFQGIQATSLSRSQYEQDYLAGNTNGVTEDSAHVKGAAIDFEYNAQVWDYLKRVGTPNSKNSVRTQGPGNTQIEWQVHDPGGPNQHIHTRVIGQHTNYGTKKKN